jgi:hypothetical protein
MYPDYRHRSSQTGLDLFRSHDVGLGLFEAGAEPVEEGGKVSTCYDRTEYG